MCDCKELDCNDCQPRKRRVIPIRVHDVPEWNPSELDVIRLASVLGDELRKMDEEGKL